jgi:hypothetical protein
VIQREISRVLVLNLLWHDIKQAVLAHRLGNYALDKAFALVEGNPHIFRRSSGQQAVNHKARLRSDENLAISDYG